MKNGLTVRPRDWFRIRWTLVRYRILTWVARSRFGYLLGRIVDEHHPILNMDFAQSTLNKALRERYQYWQLELREYFHKLDFPEYFGDKPRSRPYTGPLMASLDDCIH